MNKEPGFPVNQFQVGGVESDFSDFIHWIHVLDLKFDTI